MTQADWIEVEPEHCHKRRPENVLIRKLRVVSDDRRSCELLLDMKPGELPFFFDHEIDHFPGMLELCALRQSALACAHLVYDVPMDFMVVLGWLEVRFFSFAEIAPPIVAKVDVLEWETTANHASLVMEGLLVQEGTPLIKMKGSLLAYSPRLAPRIRRYKTPMKRVEAVVGRERRSAQPIVEVHLVGDAERFDQICTDLAKVLRRKTVSAYELVPLYFSYDEEDPEARVCFVYRDPKALGDFVVDHLRSIPGIRSSQVRLTLDGQLFHSGVEALVKGREGRVSSHIFLKIEPAYDHVAWDALRALSSTDQVFPTWCMRDFYDYERDVTLRLMGASKDSIEDYLSRFVVPIEGVSVTRVKFMKNFVAIQSDDRLLALAQHWIA